MKKSLKESKPKVKPEDEPLVIEVNPFPSDEEEEERIQKKNRIKKLNFFKRLKGKNGRKTSQSSSSSNHSLPVPVIESSPLLKDNYLKSGLLSVDFKGMEEADNGLVTEEKVSETISQETKEDSSEEPKLLQPLLEIFSKVLFTSTTDFELPFDVFVWDKVFRDQAPASQQQPVISQEDHPIKPSASSKRRDLDNKYSRPYRKVTSNLFVDVIPVSGHESLVCQCSPSEGDYCSSSICLNRATQTECDAKDCPCQSLCQNQKMSKTQWMKGLQRFWTGDERGWGIRCSQPIKAGDFIMEYIGEVLSMDLFKKRMNEKYCQDLHHFCLNIDSSCVIDAYRVANEGRFVNHSCQPNCEAQKWSVDGVFRVGIFAKRDILAGEELSYDYNFDNFNSKETQKCFCCHEKCRGFIGRNKKKEMDTKNKDMDNKSKSEKAKKTTKSLKTLKKEKSSSKKEKQEQQSVETSSKTTLSSSVTEIIESVVRGKKHDTSLVKEQDKQQTKETTNEEKKTKPKVDDEKKVVPKEEQDKDGQQTDTVQKEDSLIQDQVDQKREEQLPSTEKQEDKIQTIEPTNQRCSSSKEEEEGEEVKAKDIAKEPLSKIMSASSSSFDKKQDKNQEILEN